MTAAEAQTTEVAPSLGAAQLRHYETLIEKGLTTFVEVGDALCKIRDGKLYKLAGYGRFDAYLKERWQLSRSYAYQLIDAAKVSAIADVSNEAQARELVPVLKAKGPETVATVFEEANRNGIVTAATLRGAVHDVMYPRRDPGPMPRPLHQVAAPPPVSPAETLANLERQFELALGEALQEALEDVMAISADDYHAAGVTRKDVMAVEARVEDWIFTLYDLWSELKELEEFDEFEGDEEPLE